MVDAETFPFRPESVAHPGEVLQEYLEANSWSQRALARRTGLTAKTISEICSAKAPITTNTALALEQAFNRPAHFWLNLQRQFDELRARRDLEDSLAAWGNWAARFPVSTMRKLGWIGAADTKEAAADSLLKFFGVASPDRWSELWEGTAIQYRQTRQFKTSLEAVSAWARATEIRARDIPTAPFSAAGLRQSLAALRPLTRKRPEEFVPASKAICAAAGVAVVWIPELPETGISGCARWLSSQKALIALTLRYKSDDQVWFTFFHEIGHILLHRQRDGFILDNAADQLTDNVVDPEMRQQEEEANRFAADTILPPEELRRFIDRGVFDTDAIVSFAAAQDIGPGLVVGRLQRDGFLNFSQGNKLKRSFDWALPSNDAE